MRKLITSGSIVTIVLASAIVGGCAPSSIPNTQDVVSNAINDDLTITEADNDRADRLDDKAIELSAEANTTSGATQKALRDEAQADFAAAAELRQKGQNEGAQIEDAVERNAGLLNGY